MDSTTRFTTEAYPIFQQISIWEDTLRRHQLSTRHLSGDGSADLYGTLVAKTSLAGMELLKIASVPQEIVVDSRPDAIWLSLHLDGEGRFCDDNRSEWLDPGDIIVVGSSQARTSLAFRSNFCELVARVPRLSLDRRLARPMSGRAQRISTRSGIGQVFAGLLKSLAEIIEIIDIDQIGVIETTLCDLLASTVAENDDDTISEGMTASQAMILNRVQQAVERHLADPDISIETIAGEAGISPRSLQKLFEATGQSFSGHIRHRRLERCRADLSNPVFHHLSISAIGFRWGFSDAAHFSRTFRDQYGSSPRAWRQQVSGSAVGTRIAHQLRRGWPDQPSSRRRDAPTIARGASSAAGLNLQCVDVAATPARHYLPATRKTVHWGYFSRRLDPVLEINSGDVVTIETLTQHASDDPDRMIKGDPGAEGVFHWTATEKAIDRRGAGPIDASIYGRGPGEGFGVHICTGPIFVRNASPGDILEIRILDVFPRLSANPNFPGQAFGSNAAAWWGFHYSELLTEPKPREVVTIYQIDCTTGGHCAHAVYNFRWTPQTDPAGVVHSTIDYPGVPVDPASIEKNYNVLKDIRVPVRPHFGVIAVAPKEVEIVDSIPPSYFGGNIDNWRLGKGAKLLLPVGVAGALLSVGDPHASQGDGELCGTAIECSLTGVFQIILHKKQDLTDNIIADVNYPLIETPEEWVLHGFSHPNYLVEFGEKAHSKVYEHSTLDLAMKDAFRKARRFLMSAKGLSEDEAISLISVAVDFGITQVVDGNVGVHAIIRKDLFPNA